MASDQTNASSFGTSTNATPVPGWWSRPILTYPAPNERKATTKEEVACIGPCCGGLFTGIFILLIFVFIDNAHSHAKFSIQSLDVLSNHTAATSSWHTEFLVINPSSKYTVYYDDDVSVWLGGQKAAVGNITHQRLSRDVSTFSLVYLIAKEEVVDLGQLDVKLRGKHKRYVKLDEAGFFNVRCRNVTASHDKFICHSTFTHSHILTFTSSSRLRRSRR